MNAVFRSVVWIMKLRGRHALPWVSMATITASGCTLAWVAASQEAAELRELHTTQRREYTHSLEQRLHAYEQVLRGAASYMSLRQIASRQEFHRYVENLQLGEQYPGIQGVGFAQRLSAEQLDQHTAAIRAEGFTGYTVWPKGPRATYTSIIYLEPFSGRNLRAFGYDMYAEKIRQKAMDQACDTGEPALSGKVTLVQETNKDVQAGFLLYVPIYRNGVILDTVADRRANLLGWVYAPFRMNDFMAHLQSDRPDKPKVRVYYGPAASPESLLFSTDTGPPARADSRQLLEESDLSGYPWKVFFVQNVDGTDTLGIGKATLIALLSMVLGLLVAFAMRHLLSAHQQASQRALRSTEALRRTEVRLAFALQEAGIGLWELDIPRKTIIYSVRCFEMIGHTAESVLAGPGRFSEVKELVLHPEEQAAVTEGFLSHLRGETAGFSHEHRIRHQDGSYIWVHSRGSVTERNAAGWPLRFFGLLENITERKTVEFDRLQVNRRLELAIQASQCGVWEWNVSTGRMMADPRTLEIHGLQAGLFRGGFEDWSRTVHAGDAAGVQRIVASALSGHGKVDEELSVTTPTGETRHVRYFGTVLKNDSHGTQVMVGVVMDQTELKRTEAQLIQSRQQAESANRAKSEFLAMMSHELRTPLNAVLGLSESLLASDRAITTEKSHRYLTIINESGKRLLSVIDNVLDHARIEHGSLKPDYQPCRVLQAVTATLTIIQTQLIKKRLQLRRSLPEAEITIMADERLLKQAVYHLLSNAMKFSSEGGMINVEMRALPDGVEIAVSDMGIGIPQGKLESLFKAFQQGDATLARRFDGVGLGLYLCDSIVRLHGGHITVSSVENSGSRFTLFFRTDPGRAISVASNSPQSRQGHLLLVDDDASHALVVGEFCVGSEFTLEYASSGRSALDLLQRSKPSAVVVDLCLPGLDGYETIRNIRANPFTQNLPIAVMSALTMPGERELAMEAGANVFLEKPCGKDAFLGCIRRLM